MAAQLVHAAGESVTSELPPGVNAVVLGVPTEHALRTLAKKLSLAGIAHVLIREDDPPYTAQCTAIGIVPLTDREIVKPYLKKLPLLQKICFVEPAPIKLEVGSG